MRVKTVAGFVGVLGVVFVAAAMLAQGCGGSSPAACAVGKETCPCTAGGACDTGLTCASMKCVNLVTVDGGGTAGATGTAGGGGAAGGGTAGAGSTDPNVACANLGAICDRFNDCAPLLVTAAYGSVDKCKTRFALSCKDAFTAPDSGLTATSIAACSDALPGASCSDILYRKVSECSAKGTRPNGSACGTNEQCHTGYCAQNAAACGVCAEFIAAGGTCGVDDDCTPGLICSDDLHCVIPGAPGTPCNTNQPCQYGNYCRMGSCVAAQTTAGGMCTDAGSCEILKGNFCNTSVNSCQTIASAQPGSPCGVVNNTVVICAGGDCIYANAADAAGLCAAPVMDGQPCGGQAANSAGCLAPARCINSRCTLPNSKACN
jgi:hypothetical protein